MPLKEMVAEDRTLEDDHKRGNFYNFYRGFVLSLKYYS
jgi:hypothetical protein